MILAGDIGGTKTTLGLFSREQGPHDPLQEETFPSRDYRSLEAIIEVFLARHQVAIKAACFGVAGPVVGGRAQITNLPWIIDTPNLRRLLATDYVTLINDLEAIAWSVPVLQPADLAVLNTGTPIAGGAIAVIAPGTGLGEAYLTWDGTHYRAYPSEGGHASFAPNTPHEIDLLRFLLKNFDHVSAERVCSGMGIPNIYGYFRDQVFQRESAWVARQLKDARDPTPVIVAAAQADPPCPVCEATMATFVEILGAEASNLALKVLATGGVFLGGGIPPRIISLLRHDRFLKSMRDKGRFGAVIERAPVHVILNPKVALLGAASRAMQ
jgi:glucokinase